MWIKPNSAFYKNPALWLVVLVPAFTVVAGISFLVFSIIYQDELVVDDYYKLGKQINLVLARDDFARQHGLSANIRLDQQKHLVFVQLDVADEQGFDYDAEVTLKFIHRTLADHDQVMLLERNARAGYFAVLKQSLAGRWLVELGAEQWRLKETMVLDGQDEFSLSAGEY